MKASHNMEKNPTGAFSASVGSRVSTANAVCVSEKIEMRKMNRKWIIEYSGILMYINRCGEIHQIITCILPLQKTKNRKSKVIYALG